MANPARHPVPVPRYRRGVIVLGAVIGAHLLVLFLATSMHDSAIERPVEPVTITAMLLSPDPESKAPVAAAAPATPPAAPHAALPRALPAMQAQPQKPLPTQTPAPPRSRASRNPAVAAPVEPPGPAPSTAPDAASPAPAAAPPSPAVERSVAAAPKNVAHIDCRIPPPDYPDPSKRRRENGTAIVRFVVGTDGRIETMQLQKSSGYPRLDDAALAAVHEGVCAPYSENGVPVRAAYSQAFVFGLTD